MKVESVTYGQRHHVNMGSFEWVELAASATVITTDGKETAEDLLADARAIVDTHLAQDLERAIETTGEDETYVETWVDGPKRRQARRRQHS
ncbi:hypothetical protein [Nonomuraea typhae]|uniref:DUF1902 domain-containing protein n=1 Tax=Nonomuraea typhae TaxID=2603600 RepID=A0ABW7YJ48_9ACTN